MTAVEWTALVVAAIGALGTIVLQGLQMYFTHKRDAKVETKLDHNTALTEKGSKASTEVVSTITQKLNGGVDAAIKPLRDAFEEYTARNEASLRELRASLIDLRGMIRAK